MSRELREFVSAKLGHQPKDLALFERALTHSSLARDSYERLEFLGDRVLGLVIGRWLYERFGAEPEGQLSRRHNALVARETCAEVGRALGVAPLIRLGKQAREDGASNSDNVVGDVVEALIGALLLDGGIDAADAFVRRAWEPHLERQGKAPEERTWHGRLLGVVPYDFRIPSIERLRQARLEAGLTQVEAGKHLKKPQAYISKIERGERRLDAVELDELAKLYSKPLNYFVK